MDKIECNNLYANDIDNEIIAFYQYIHDGGEPLTDITREQYYDIKQGNNIIKRGNIKNMVSFGGKPWGGYGNPDKRSNKTHYAASLNNFVKQIPAIKRTIFSCNDFKQLKFLPNSFIYCDAPYINMTTYGSQDFDYIEYYYWLEEISKTNFVIISEYTMPDNFICFKSICHKKSLKAEDNSTHVYDNLYFCKGLFQKWYEGDIR